jgi:hypothetical protein
MIGWRAACDRCHYWLDEGRVAEQSELKADDFRLLVLRVTDKLAKVARRRSYRSLERQYFPRWIADWRPRYGIP